MASRKPAASIARYGQVPGVRVTNDATRRRLRYRPDTATAFQRTPGHTDASTAGGPPPGLRHQYLVRNLCIVSPSLNARGAMFTDFTPADLVAILNIPRLQTLPNS